MLDPNRDNLSAYPEGTVKIDGYKTPCHAAAETGCSHTLELLLEDIQKRWDKVMAQSKVNENFHRKFEQ